MAVEGSDAEARVLEIERWASRLNRRLTDLEAWRTRTVEERLAMGWTMGPWDRGFEVTISGQVRGCSSLGYPFADVLIRNSATLATIATLTADASGNYSVTVTLFNDPTSIDIVATPTGVEAPKFAPSATVTTSVHSGANTAPVITIFPSSSGAVEYCCTPPTGTYVPGPMSVQICAHIQSSCSGNPAVAGATVQLKSGGVTVIDSGTTDASGNVCFTVTKSFSGIMVASKTGWTSASSSTVNVSCGSATANRTMNLSPTTTSIQWTVNDCNSGYTGVYPAGALVEAKQGGVTVGTCTTDAAGQCTISNIPAGSTTYVVSKTDYLTDTSGPENLTGSCATAGKSVALNPDSTHFCACYRTGGGPPPIPFFYGVCQTKKTLTLTDIQYGPVTMTYDATSNTYKGSLAVSYPGGTSCGCPGASVTLLYEYGNLDGGTSPCRLRVTLPCYIPGGIYGTNVCPGGGGAAGNSMDFPCSGGSCHPFLATFAASGGIGTCSPYCGTGLATNFTLTE